MNPLVSIIIPVYNGANYLTEAIDSALAQTYTNIEIICIDDGSTDSSPDILSSYKRKDSRIKVISKTNEGVSLARNNGLKFAQGEYIVFLDSDDWLDKNYIEVLLIEAIKNDADVVMCSYAKEFHRKSYTSHFFPFEYHTFSGDELKNAHIRMFGPTGSELSSPQTLDWLSPVWKQLIKADVCKKCCFEDIKQLGTFEDGLFQIDLYSYVSKMVYVDKPMYHYRKTNTPSITSQYKPNLFQQRQYLYELMDGRIQNTLFSLEYSNALSNRIAIDILGIGLNEINSEEGIFVQSKKLKYYLNSSRYIQAFAALDYSYFPFYWWFFFKLCRYKCSLPLVLLLNIIKFLMKSR